MAESTGVQAGNATALPVHFNGAEDEWQVYPNLTRLSLKQILDQAGEAQGVDQR